MEEIVLDENTLLSNQPQRGDEGLYVRFYMRAKLNKLKSYGREAMIDNRTGHILLPAVVGAGRPIYDNVEYCFIGGAGDKFVTHDQPATNKERARFNRQYKAFKDGQKEVQSGTPLEKWPLIDQAQAEELKFFNIRTVEQLALLPDGNIPNIGNVTHLKKLAGDWIEAAKGAAPLTQMRAELETRDAQIAALQRQMQEMIAATMASKAAAPAPSVADAAAAVAAPEASKKKPGRPAKKTDGGVHAPGSDV